MAARIYNFPSILENAIRLASATHWSPADNYGAMFTADKSYLLKIDAYTEEFYVTDNQGIQNYSFYIIEGNFKNWQKEKDLLQQVQ